MPPSMAGATTTGTEVARHAAVIVSPARPWAMAAEPVRRGGGDDDCLDVVGGADVADPPVGLERQHVDIDRVAAKGLERQRPDEGGRGRGS